MRDAIWVKRAILAGFALLCRLNLYGKPMSDEDREDEAEVWVLSLVGSEDAQDFETDAVRIGKGFAKLLAKSGLRRWPVPDDLRECMPSRPKRELPRNDDLVALPADLLPPEENHRRWQELATKMNRSFGTTFGVKSNAYGNPELISRGDMSKEGRRMRSVDRFQGGDDGR